MKNSILVLLATFSLFGLGSCSNSTPNDPVLQLPPETQTGANTFGCYINGKLLIPRNGTGTIGGSDDGMSYWGDPTGTKQFNEIDVGTLKAIEQQKY